MPGTKAAAGRETEHTYKGDHQPLQVEYLHDTPLQENYGYLETFGFWFKIKARMGILPQAYS